MQLLMTGQNNLLLNTGEATTWAGLTVFIMGISVMI